MIQNFLNPEGHKSPIGGSKVTAILLKVWFSLLVELHREGSAPALSKPSVNHPVFVGGEENTGSGF